MEKLLNYLLGKKYYYYQVRVCYKSKSGRPIFDFLCTYRTAEPDKTFGLNGKLRVLYKTSGFHELLVNSKTKRLLNNGYLHMSSVQFTHTLRENKWKLKK